jgi:hypothetical protein
MLFSNGKWLYGFEEFSSCGRPNTVRSDYYRSQAFYRLVIVGSKGSNWKGEGREERGTTPLTCCVG